MSPVYNYKIMLVSSISTTMDTTVGAGTDYPLEAVTSTSDFKWNFVSSVFSFCV